MIGSRWKWWPGDTDYPSLVTIIRVIDAEIVEVCYTDEYAIHDQLVPGEDTWTVKRSELTPDV